MTIPKPPAGFELIEEEISGIPPPPPGFELQKPSRAKSLARAAGKGLLKAAISAQDIIPLAGKGPLSSSQQLKSLMGLIGEPEEGLGERITERTAETLPFLLGGPGGIAPKVGRALLASTLGQTAEELGAGEVGQTAAELLGLGLPGLRKKIVPTKAQKAGVEMLRRRGLTEKEIAPLIPGERKSAMLGKFGTKGFRTKKAAERTDKALGNLYSQLIAEGEKLPILSSGRSQSLQTELNDKLKKMPSSVRKVIKEDMQDLFFEPIKGNNIINFWQDLNSKINWKSIKGGNKDLNSLKDSLKKALSDISPKLAKDFVLTNEFYSKFKPIFKNLIPQNMDRFIAISELAALIGGFLKYGPKGAAGVVLTEASRKVASEMLINPRLQNLVKQMANAVKNNKIAIAKKVDEKIKKELEKEGINVEKLISQKSSPKEKES